MDNVTGNVTWIKLNTNIFDVGKLPVISAMQDGAMLELLWVKLLILAGQANNDGYLYVANSIAYDKKTLANRCKVKEKLMENALKIFKNFGMIEEENGVFLIKNWAKYQNVDGMEKVREQTRKRVSAYRERHKSSPDVTECNVTGNATVTQCNATEEKRRDIEEKKENILKEKSDEDDLSFLDKGSPTDVGSPKQEEPVFIELILNNGSMYGVPVKDVEEYKKLYPAVDVEQELRNMAGWCMANETNRKTKTGIKRFINSWLSKEQNRGSWGRRINSVEDVKKIGKNGIEVSAVPSTDLDSVF